MQRLIYWFSKCSGAKLLMLSHMIYHKSRLPISFMFRKKDVLSNKVSGVCREESEFCSMLEVQMQTGRYLPEKNLDAKVDEDPVELLDGPDQESADIPFHLKHHISKWGKNLIASDT